MSIEVCSFIGKSICYVCALKKCGIEKSFKWITREVAQRFRDNKIKRDFSHQFQLAAFTLIWVSKAFRRDQTGFSSWKSSRPTIHTNCSASIFWSRATQFGTHTQCVYYTHMLFFTLLCVLFLLLYTLSLTFLPSRFSRDFLSFTVRLPFFHLLACGFFYNISKTFSVHLFMFACVFSAVCLCLFTFSFYYDFVAAHVTNLKMWL